MSDDQTKTEDHRARKQNKIQLPINKGPLVPCLLFLIPLFSLGARGDLRNFGIDPLCILVARCLKVLLFQSAIVPGTIDQPPQVIYKGQLLIYVTHSPWPDPGSVPELPHTQNNCQSSTLTMVKDIWAKHTHSELVCPFLSQISSVLCVLWSGSSWEAKCHWSLLWVPISCSFTFPRWTCWTTRGIHLILHALLISQLDQSFTWAHSPGCAQQLCSLLNRIETPLLLCMRIHNDLADEKKCQSWRNVHNQRTNSQEVMISSVVLWQRRVQCILCVANDESLAQQTSDNPEMSIILDVGQLEKRVSVHCKNKLSWCSSRHKSSRDGHPVGTILNAQWEETNFQIGRGVSYRLYKWWQISFNVRSTTRTLHPAEGQIARCSTTLRSQNQPCVLALC